jgi:hypothetical protein
MAIKRHTTFRKPALFPSGFRNVVWRFIALSVCWFCDLCVCVCVFVQVCSVVCILVFFLEFLFFVYNIFFFWFWDTRRWTKSKNTLRLMLIHRQKPTELIYTVIVQSVKRLSYGLDDRGSRVRFPTSAGNFSLHHCIQNDSGAHPDSYPMDTRDSFSVSKAAGAWSWQLTSIQCRGQRMCRAILPFPQYAFMTWCSVKISTRTTLFYFKC